MLAGALEKAGFEFVAVPRDSAGVKRVADFNCDLVLWDLEDSSPNEPTPAERLRKSGLEDMPVAVIVQGGQGELAARSLAEGAADFLYKPLGKDPLPRILASLSTCLLYTSDAADDLLCVDLGGRRIIKKKKKI